MLEALDLYEAKQTIQALILCPTRELALQVTDEIRSISRYMEHVQPVAIYGGAPIDKQCIKLRRCNVVIGTPGRVLDHIKRKTIKFKSLKMLVLDEADEMLSMGFKDELESILTNLPKERQTLLFSATIPPAILDISKKYLNDPEKIEIEPEKMTLDNIEQKYILCVDKDKPALLNSFLSKYMPKKAIIFCNTKKAVDELDFFLNKNGFNAVSLHGDMKQSLRTTVMYDFKKGKTQFLIATDVAARGIDVSDVDYVINYDLPQNIEYYIHRIDRKSVV